MSAPEEPPGPRPSAYAVGSRVLLACLVWGSLTGAVVGIVFLVILGAAQGVVPDVITYRGGQLVPSAALAGALIGFLFAVVFGIGSGLGAMLAARSASPRGTATSTGSPTGSRGASADEPATVQEVATVVRWTRTGFVLTAVVLLVIALVGGRGGQRDWSSPAAPLLLLALGLPVGVWRSGRAARLAMHRAPLLRLPSTF